MAVGGGLLLKAFVDSWSQPLAPRGDVRASRATVSAVSSADPCDRLRDLPRGHSAHDSLAMQNIERDVRQLQRSCWVQPDSCHAYLAGLEQACDAGLPLSCRWLGEELRSGKHTVRDQDRADDLFTRQFDLAEQACAEGDRSACLGQAEMQDRGVGTTVDRAAARHLVECLCDQDASDCSFTRQLLAHDEWPVEPLPGSLLANCEAWHRWPEPVDSPLEQAFRSGSRARLVAVLDEWHSSVSPASADDLRDEPASVREAYELFPVLYNPRDLSRIGRSQWGSGFMSDIHYAIVQDAIRVQVDGETARFVERFRPRIRVGDLRALYPDAEHAGWLKAFLGCDMTEVGVGGITNPAMPKGESLRRFRFLAPLLPVRPNVFGTEWQLETHPYVQSIRFDSTLTQATFSFRVAHEGGTGTAEKTHGVWRITRASSNWVE
jgi:hypothetical protein